MLVEPFDALHLGIELADSALQIDIAEPAPRRQPRERSIVRIGFVCKTTLYGDCCRISKSFESVQRKKFRGCAGCLREVRSLTASSSCTE